MTEDEQAVAFGARVRELRLRRGMSQRDLAELTGIKRPNIARIESGRLSHSMQELSLPTLRTVKRVADGLGVPAVSLVSAIDEPVKYAEAFGGKAGA